MVLNLIELMLMILKLMQGINPCLILAVKLLQENRLWLAVMVKVKGFGLI